MFPQNTSVFVVSVLVGAYEDPMGYEGEAATAQLATGCFDQKGPVLPQRTPIWISKCMNHEICVYPMPPMPYAQTNEKQATWNLPTKMMIVVLSLILFPSFNGKTHYFYGHFQ